MRFSIIAMCAIALAGCSDHQAPTSTSNAQPRVRATGLPDGFMPDSASKSLFDPRSVPERIEAMFAGRVTKVRLPPDDYSRSSDAVHPDMVCPGDVWNAVRCWLLYTPYVGGDNTYENPSFLYAADDTSWGTPPSIRNPLVVYPGGGAYNSDPDHAFDPVNRRLVQVYRLVANGYNNIMIMSTANARQWTTPRIAFRELNHDAVSPALIIGPDRTASLWYVRAGANGCSAKQTRVVMRSARPDQNDQFEQSAWSEAVATDLQLPGYVPWHLDVAALPNGEGYVAFVAAFQVGTTCGASDLWLATSRDGMHWHAAPIPLLWRGMQVARARNMSTWYRGTIRYDAATDTLHLWPSALSASNWTIYHTAVKLHQVLALLDAADPGDLSLLVSHMARQHIPRAALPMP